MALFENYDRRIDKINGVLKQYGIESVEACREMCQAKGFDPYEIVKGIQPICFENACLHRRRCHRHEEGRQDRCRSRYRHR